jgi:hypothetical protein
MGVKSKRKTNKSASTRVIREIFSYKRKLQAFLIHFELVNNQEMIRKLHKADLLLDKHLKKLI